jgi:hypothetical protein
MFFCFHRGQFFQGAIFALWIALWGLLPKAEKMEEGTYSSYAQSSSVKCS